jgi:ABC-type multidrug transport system ATPase subunit
MSHSQPNIKPLLLVTEHLTKTYPNDITATKDLSLTVQEGEFLSLIG